MNILDYQSYYLVGIKGVAMTAIAQCLLDAGKKVSGSDLAEEFVTQPLLAAANIHIDIGFEGPLPAATDCVIYTAAHSSQDNPQVKAAVAAQIPCFPHAQALGALFDLKKGIAVCGVGGKSTTSAMVAFILELTKTNPSFAIGVGDIVGLHKTGQWRADGEWFVAEADEYVIDPAAPSKGVEITPRFSFLHPSITICTNLKFDHPDVYRDFAHTQAVFQSFFGQTKANGTLVLNAADDVMMELGQAVAKEKQLDVITFGQSATADAQIMSVEPQPGHNVVTFLWQGQQYQLELHLPGYYNAANAVAACVATHATGVEMSRCVEALAHFRSTLRRAELIGTKNGVVYYDDYAHHPDEIRQVVAAFREWYPQARLVVAFQSHTFSRTKALFAEFVTAFADADEVAMIDIFPSAREQADHTVSSTLLCEAISQHFPQKRAQNFGTLAKLASHLQETLQPGDVCITVGAGDIYQVHHLIK